MNISDALINLFQPARAARFDAIRKIAFIPGSEKAVLANLLRTVRNAEIQSGFDGRCGSAWLLEGHAGDTGGLKPVELVDTVAALKREYQQTLSSLMRNSAGTQSGSAYDHQIRAIRKVIDASRNFCWDVSNAGQALARVSNITTPDQRSPV